MAYNTIKTDVADGILTLTMHRPEKMNAFTGEMMHEMIDAFDKSDADDNVRCVIVTGEGRAFCAGADLGAGGATFDRNSREDREPIPVGPDGQPDVTHEAARDGGGRVTLRIFNSLKPVIAAVNGPAVGIGMTMQLPMDIRLASEDARFGFVFSQRGIVMEAASSWFLPRLVGMQQAADWVYSGRVFSAQEALKGGLVKEIYAKDDLLPAARELARTYTEKTAPVSVALMRQMMWRMMGAEHPMDAHRVDSRGIFYRGKSADVKEGVMSFLEKRPAKFTDTVSGNMPPYFPWWDEPKYK